MEVEDLGHHISRRFNEDLERVRNSVLAMGGLVEEQLDRAIKALSEGDSALGLQVAEDDQKVNRMEVSIDEECSRILATRAPTAGDLRLVIAIIKTITDLERIGDEAEKIGVLAARLASVERPATNYRELRNLARHVKQMVHNALDSFARFREAELAAIDLLAIGHHARNGPEPGGNPGRRRIGIGRKGVGEHRRVQFIGFPVRIDEGARKPGADERCAEAWRRAEQLVDEAIFGAAQGLEVQAARRQEGRRILPPAVGGCDHEGRAVRRRQQDVERRRVHTVAKLDGGVHGTSFSPFRPPCHAGGFARLMPRRVAAR